MKKIDLSKPSAGRGIDDRYALLLGRCQQKKTHYLIKYQKAGDAYDLVGAYPLEASYFDLSAQGQGEPPRVDSTKLMGAPVCPCCERSEAMCQCACGKLHCGAEGRNTCPWCGATGTYGLGAFTVECAQG